MAGKLLITPNNGSTTVGQDPTIKFQGTGNATDITLRTATDGSLSFEGSTGQLFSIADSQSGTIYSVNDISGIPSVEVLDTGLVKLAQYSGNVVIGSGADGGYKFQLTGTGYTLGNWTHAVNSSSIYGPNTTWGGYLYVGGNGVGGIARTNDIASVVSTNGTLHLDSGTTRAMYLNYYSGSGGLLFGNGASAVTSNLSSTGFLGLGLGSTTASYRLETPETAPSGSKMFRFGGVAGKSLYGYSDSGGVGISSSDPYTSGALIYMMGTTTVHYAGSTGVMSVKTTGIEVTGTVVSTSGFQTGPWVVGRNRFSSLSNADGYGISYFQGSGGYGGTDSIGMHFGTATAAASQFTFRTNGDLITTGRINGSNITGTTDWNTMTTAYGNIQLGPANAGTAHIYTDRPSFYFNKALLVNGAYVTMDTSAERPGPTRLYRRDDNSNYNIQISWQTDASGYWSIRGYTSDSFHAHCWVGMSGYATNAGTVGGFTPTTAIGTANRVVVADASGYIANTWFNSNRGDEATTAASYIYDTGDGYMRKKSLANAKAEIVTSAAVTSGLGYTPYYSSNPSNYDTAGGSSPPLQAYSSSGGAVMAFHRAGVYAVNMGLDSDNVFRIGGWSAGANRLQMDMSGNLTMFGNVTAYSDERLKTNWRTLPVDFVSRLAKVRSGIYDRTDESLTQVGVSAQSLQELMPDAVSENADGMLSVSYGNAALAACVELAKEVTALRAEIELLKSKIPN